MEEKTEETLVTNQKIKANVIPFVWLYTIVVAGVMWIITQDFMIWPFYFILGSAVSLFNFSILLRYVNRTKPEDLKKGMFLNYLIRYAMYIIIFLVAFLKENGDFQAIIATGIGCFSLRIVLIIYTLIKRGEKI